VTVGCWIVGNRGLLGGAVRDAMVGSLFTVVPSEPLPWAGTDAELTAAAERNLRLMPAGDWCVAWCAGSSVTGADEASVARELHQLELVLGAIRRWASGRDGAGGVFYASSAGGVYAGSADPPFTEESVPSPLSPYGRGKLRAEELVRELGTDGTTRTLIARIANLYGPAQSLQKPQGLITHLARAQLSPTPASIYVPLETTRDYIYASDAALLITDALTRLFTDTPAGTSVTKIIASGDAVTIATLLGHFSVLSKAHPHVMLGFSSSAAYQAVDLRLQSTVWPDLDHRDMTSLPAGIHSVLLQMTLNVQDGQHLS
jgi:UDP-glucose 4-epimerase